jgi:hypothetical protein
MSVSNDYKKTNPISVVIKSIAKKLFQSPEVYPIRYYKKAKRFKRNWQDTMVK